MFCISSQQWSDLFIWHYLIILNLNSPRQILLQFLNHFTKRAKQYVLLSNTAYFEFIGGFSDQWMFLVLMSCFQLKKKEFTFLMEEKKNIIWEKIVFYCCPLSLQTLREKIRKSAVLQLTAAEIDTFSDASPQSPWYTYFKLPNKLIARIIELHMYEKECLKKYFWFQCKPLFELFLNNLQSQAAATRLTWHQDQRTLYWIPS